MQDLIFFFGPPLASFVLCLLMWLIAGRDPRVADSIFPHYERPQGLSVIESGVLMDDILQTKDITYELYDLYFKGLVNFEDDLLKLMKSKSSPEIANLTLTQRAILDIMFPGNSTATRLSSQITSIKSTRIKTVVYQALVNQGYYKSPPNLVRRKYYFMGYLMILFAIGFNIVSFLSIFDPDNSIDYQPFFLPLSLIIGLILGGLVWGVFGTVMARKTVAGVKMRNGLLGLKEFIITAEKDRIEYFLKSEPEVYKDILPFAFLFGVEENWLAPAEELGKNFLDDDLRTVTFEMDLEGFEGLFEEKQNIVIGLINIVAFALIQALKIALSGMFSRGAHQEFSQFNSTMSEEEIARIKETAFEEQLKYKLEQEKTKTEPPGR